MSESTLNYKVEKCMDGRRCILLTGEDIIGLLSPDAYDAIQQRIDECGKSEEECFEMMELNDTFHYQIFIELPSGE